MAMNYHWAPRGEGRREAALQAMTLEKTGKPASHLAIMYRNTDSNRTGSIGSMPCDPMRGSASATSRCGRPMTKAACSPAGTAPPGAGGPARLWSLDNGIAVTYDGKGQAIDIRPFDSKENDSGSRVDLPGWTETPWSIISGSLLPDNLSVSELASDPRARPGRSASGEAQCLPHPFLAPLRLPAAIAGARADGRAPRRLLLPSRCTWWDPAGSVFIFFWPVRS